MCHTQNGTFIQSGLTVQTGISILLFATTEMDRLDSLSKKNIDNSPSTDGGIEAGTNDRQRS